MLRSRRRFEISSKAHVLWINLFCTLLVLGAAARGLFATLDHQLLDAFLRARGSRYPHPNIVLVVADNNTEKANRWPLPRALYADVISEVSRAGAKTIALDILFSAPSHSVADDNRLIAACRKSGRVVQAAAFDFLSQSQSPVQVASVISDPSSSSSSRLDSRFRVPVQHISVREAVSVTAPLPTLQHSAAAVGHVNVLPDADGVLRHIRHLVRFRDAVYPSLSLAIAAHYLDLKPTEVEATLARVVNDNGFSTDPSDENGYFSPDQSGTSRINWVGASGAFPTFNFNQVLSGKVPEEAFKNRIVLVGATATAAHEFRTTPFSRVQPAIEVQANALNDILSRRPLIAVPIWIIAALILGCALLTSLLVVKRGAAIGGISLLLVVAGLSSGAFMLVKADIFLPLAAPLASVLFAFSCSAGLLQVLGARELKQSVQDLREAEERYALAVRGANDGIWDWDLQSDEIYYSPRWKEMLGIEPDEISNTPQQWFKRIHDDDVEQVKSDLAAHLGHLTPSFQSEHRIRYKDGTYRWVLSRGVALRGELNVAYRISGSLTDITERKNAEQQLRYNAFHDGLTQLPNRSLFMDRLQHVMELNERQHHLFAVLFLDIDRFKVVNDSLGHPVGDQLLIQVAQRLQDCLRVGDTLARFGGDEFSVLLDGLADVSEATALADRIHASLAAPFVLETQDTVHDISTSASIGIAWSLTGYDEADALLRDADIAMYRAKSKGPGQYEVFDRAMHDRALSLLQLENELRKAIDLLRQGQSQFHLVYQPIVALDSGLIAGFEALIRWHHPERGFISPGEFIPLAEDTRLILPLSEWVLREACCQLRHWQDRFTTQKSLFMSVNLSVKELSEDNVVERVAALLTEIGLNPHDLKLEITESAIMENAEAATAKLSQLKSLGVRLSMDDFGTGYSSLSYLHRFPLDTLKIDRSFVSRIGPDGENSELVWTIIALARNLGMDVVAEGVETNGQVAQLRTLVCDYGQGYFFSRGLECSEATALLAQMPQW
jgi:diguanylate cyclase (GGDEF)-like protein/PAS domain S-box-containing protein